MAIRRIKPLATKKTGVAKKTGLKKNPRITDDSSSKSSHPGFAKARKQQERQQKNYERKKARPFDFRITAKEISEGRNEAKLLYLDREPNFERFHSIFVGGFWTTEQCIADSGEHCPLCTKTGREGTYTLTLSALDPRPYRNKEGVLTKISRKLVYVQGKNIAKFERHFQKHGTFRGLVCTHRRHGDKEARIGEDLEFESDLVSEAKIKKHGELSEPIDYGKAFPEMTAAELNSMYADYVHPGSNSTGGQRRQRSQSEDDETPDW